MRNKIFNCALVCLLLFVCNGSKFFHTKNKVIIQEDSEMVAQKVKQKKAMQDILAISTAIENFIKDKKYVPNQDGIYDKSSGFYTALCPSYIKDLPIKDPWRNNYRIYCGKVCAGKYGIPDHSVIENDYVIASYGRDGKKEVFEFDSSAPELGIFTIESTSDLDKDIVIWCGSWIRVPRPEK